MRLRRFFTLFFLLGISALKPATGSANGKDPDLNALSDADMKTLTVHFERAGCYGNCPVYSLTIHGDGRIEYVGKNYVKVKGAQEGRIETTLVRALMSEFAKAKFWSVPEEESMKKCSCRLCTDMPSATTELTVSGVSHRVDHYYGCTCAPKALFELESAIDKTANVQQWTGDVSQQGPFGTTCF